MGSSSSSHQVEEAKGEIMALSLLYNAAGTKLRFESTARGTTFSIRLVSTAQRLSTENWEPASIMSDLSD